MKLSSLSSISVFFGKAAASGARDLSSKYQLGGAASEKIDTFRSEVTRRTLFSANRHAMLEFVIAGQASSLITSLAMKAIYHMIMGGAA